MGAELFAVPLGASLSVFGVLALVAHALVSIGTSATSAFKRYTAKQMLIAFVVVFASAFSAGGRVILRTAGGVLRWWLLVVLTFSCFSFVYVSYTEFPEVWLGTARFYNANLGPLIHQTVLAPLQVVDVLLRALLPIWDSGVWFLRALVVQGLLPVVFEEAGVVGQMATALLSMAGHLSESLVAWVDSFFCSGAACLHPEKGVIDILSPMGDARELVALGIKLGRAFCSGLAAPLDLVLFPLLDLNLAEAVHHLANALVQALTVIPRATVERCALAGGNQFDVLMCTPDLAPFFHFLVAGLSSLGQALDNWGNVALLVVETAVAGAENAPRCDPVGSGLMPDLVAGDAVFGGAATAVVGLTDWLYAVTDGRTAVYMGHSDGAQARVQVWPYPGMVDVGLGLAAVTYSSAHDLDVSALSGGQRTSGAMQTTAMLGCNCTDDALLGMRVLCSILPMAGVPVEAALKDYLLQVGSFFLQGLGLRADKGALGGLARRAGRGAVHVRRGGHPRQVGALVVHAVLEPRRDAGLERGPDRAPDDAGLHRAGHVPRGRRDGLGGPAMRRGGAGVRARGAVFPVLHGGARGRQRAGQPVPGAGRAVAGRADAHGPGLRAGHDDARAGRVEHGGRRPDELGCREPARGGEQGDVRVDVPATGVPAGGARDDRRGPAACTAWIGRADPGERAAVRDHRGHRARRGRRGHILGWPDGGRGHGWERAGMACLILVSSRLPNTHVIRSSGWPGTRPGRSACVGWRRRCRRWTVCWCRRTRRRGRTRAR
jgi:hypothetical protein